MLGVTFLGGLNESISTSTFDLDLTCVVTLWELELAFWANFHKRNW